MTQEQEEQEYVIMASGEVVTRERIAAWAAVSTPVRSTKSLLAEMLASGELVPAEDFFVPQSTLS